MDEFIKQLSALFSLGDEAAASALIDSYRELDPACYEVGLAAAALRRRDAQECRLHAELAQKLDPDDPLPLHYLSAAAALDGDPTAAEQYARRAVERGGSTKSRLMLANLLISVGKVADAEELLRKILRREPNHSEALLGLGVVRGRLGDHGEAIRLLAQSFELRPEDATPIQALIDLFANMGRVVGAIASLRAVQEQKPPEMLRSTLDLVQLELSRMLAEQYPARSVIPGADEVVDSLLRTSSSRPARVRLRVAATMTEIGRLSEAGSLLSSLARQSLSSEERGQLLFLRGQLAEREERPGDALFDYVAAVEVDRQRGDAYCNALAMLLLRGEAADLDEIEPPA